MKIVICTVAALVLSVSSYASTKDQLRSSQIRSSRVPLMRSLTPRAVQTKAKLAVLCQANGDCLVKNVISITSPDTGITCIKPSSAASLGNIRDIIPVVSAEWGTSSGFISDELLVYYVRDAGDCPWGTIEVMTYDGNYGSPELSDGVSFTLVIP